MNFGLNRKLAATFGALAFSSTVALSAAAAPQIIEGDVSGVKSFTGDVIVKGNIAAKARLTVTDGGLRVHGNVGDGAQIDQKDSSSGNAIMSGNGSVVISGNSGSLSIISAGRDVYVNGRKIEPGNASASASVISGVEVRGTVGESASVKSTNSVTAGFVKAHGVLDGGNRVTFNGSDADCQIYAGNSVVSNGPIGAKCVVQAGNSISAGDIGAGAMLTSGNSTTVGRIGEGATLSAGNSLSARCAAKSARLRAGNSTNAPGC